MVTPGVRKIVRERDVSRCRCCGWNNWLEIHHIIYRSRGGSHREENLVMLCKSCHMKAHAGEIATWELQLLVLEDCRSLRALRAYMSKVCLSCEHRTDERTGEMRCLLLDQEVTWDFSCDDWKLRKN